MGLCVSSQLPTSDKTKRERTLEPDSMQGTKIIHVDGRVQEFKHPIKAKDVTSQNSNCFLCSSESMSIGTCVPHLPDDELLLPGQIYFLLPLSQAHKPLSLHDLCNLAIKASHAVFVKNGFNFPSGDSKFILR